MGYSGYGIGFDAESQLLWSDGKWDKKVDIFGADKSSSVHGDNKKKYLGSWWRFNETVGWYHGNIKS